MLSSGTIDFSSATFDNEIKSNLKELHVEKNFCDMTISCENRQVGAHKVVLSGGSQVLKNILKQNPHSHPLIVLSDIKFSYLLKMLDFMYQGEVNIDSKDIDDFLSVANDLKIKGLTEDALKDLKQSICVSDEGNNRKRQRLVNSLNHDFNIDYDIKNVGNVTKQDDFLSAHLTSNLKAYELLEDAVKESEQSEHFAHEVHTAKNQPMVMIPEQNLSLKYGIKIEMDNLSCKPRTQKYAEDCNSEKKKEDVNTKVKMGKNMGEGRLRIRDIAKLSENTLKRQSLLTEKDVSDNVNSSNSISQLPSFQNKVEKILKSSSEKPFTCVQCNKNYTQKSSLNSHIRSIHDGVTYLCEKCDYVAKLKGDLSRHINSVHDGGTTYSCDKCNYTSKRKDNLSNHINSIHKEDTYSCEKCIFTAKRKDSLIRHINFIHNGITYPCDKCDHVAKLNSELNKHIRSNHDGATHSRDK